MNEAAARPDVAAMMQSGNGYVYGINNPIRYQDPTGHTAFVVVAAPAVVAVIAVGGGAYLVYEGGKWVWKKISKPQKRHVKSTDPVYQPSNAERADTSSGEKEKSGSKGESEVITEFRLPAWNKVTVDMEHIISGHTTGGGRGDDNKDKWPGGMTEAAIAKAIEEAYKHAEKADPVQHSWQNGVETARQFFEGVWNGRVVQFWFNYNTNQVETAWPK